jgi:ABC-type glycerol-3-phosphate transport system permease component
VEKASPEGALLVKMFNQLILCLIAGAADLIVMLALYSAASHFLAGYAWRRQGIGSLIFLIIVSQLVWLPLAFFTTVGDEFIGTASYSAWFANWLVTGFAVVLLQRKTQAISKSFADTARLDGLGALGTWRHAVLPFVRPELGLVALLLLMALLATGWHFLHFPDGITHLVLVLLRTQTFREYLGTMAAGSLAGALPLIAIAFLAKPR